MATVPAFSLSLNISPGSKVATITLNLVAGRLTRSTATRLIRAFQACFTLAEIDFVLLRILGASPAADRGLWKDELAPELAGALDGLGLDVGDGTDLGSLDDAQDGPLREAFEVVTKSGVNIVALVHGNLLNMSVGLLLWCPIVIVDADLGFSVMCDAGWVNSCAGHTLQGIPAQLVRGERLMPSDALRVGLVSAVVASQEQLQLTERNIQDFLDGGRREEDVGIWLRELRFLPQWNVQLMRIGSRPVPRRQEDEILQRNIARGGQTLILQNLPCSMTTEHLSQLLGSLGYDDHFDFAYMPSGVPPPTKIRSTLGYAFVHFPSTDVAEEFCESFNGFRFKGNRKTCSVSPAKSHGRRRIWRLLVNARATGVHKVHYPVIRFGNNA